jgi:hypothetical protein
MRRTPVLARWLDMVRAELPLDQTIACVCRSGARSAKATELFRSWGLNAVNLEGGMQSWAEAGPGGARRRDTGHRHRSCVARTRELAVTIATFDAPARHELAFAPTPPGGRWSMGRGAFGG